MSKFSERFKELRSSRKLSQQELADRLGTSKSSINMYERGEREPGLEMLENIADFFNVDMDYLIGKTQTANQALENKEKSTPQTERDVLKQKIIELLAQLNEEELKEAARYLAYLISSQDK